MFDVVVLGGGPAGMMAALRAHELGANVALVERGKLGGTAVADGVVATRVLAQAARMVRSAAEFSDFGLALPQQPEVNFPALRARILEMTNALRAKKGQRLQDLTHRMTLFTDSGDARFADAHTLQLQSGEQVTGRFIIVCVGGSPRRLNFPGHEHTITHRGVLGLDSLPQSAVIVGAGATGCQLASVLNAFGVRVTLLEAAPRILPLEDETVSSVMAQIFAARGIEIVVGYRVLERVELANGEKRLTYQIGGGLETISAEAIIMAVGWPGNAAGLNLDQIGVKTIGGNFIETNDYLQTSVPHIFAAGDITGRMLLVHSASYQGIVAAENALLGASNRAEYRAVPRGTFTEPEYAGVGLTEAQAREQYDIAVSIVPYTELDRALIDGRTAGFCKLVVERDTGKVLGAHVVGEEAREIISLVAANMSASTGVDVEKLAEYERSYPSYNTIVGLAARSLVRELELGSIKPEWATLQEVVGRSGGAA